MDFSKADRTKEARNWFWYSDAVTECEHCRCVLQPMTNIATNKSVRFTYPVGVLEEKRTKVARRLHVRINMQVAFVHPDDCRIPRK